MSEIKTKNVFGVSRDQVLSYIERDTVDGLYLSAIESEKHVIIYGASKQGKTALVEKHNPYKDNVVIRCAPASKEIDIYRTILRKHNIEIEAQKQESRSTEAKVELGVKFTAKIPMVASAEVGAAPEKKRIKTNTVMTSSIQFNLCLPDDIADLLKRVHSKKYIILENFHYLNNDVQRQLAFDLRSFQELGVKFIILGVWREKNRLTQYNGDLLDRIEEVPVEPWKRDDFIRVINKGTKILNVEFSKGLINNIIDNAFDSIGVVQEICYLVCKHANIESKQEEKKNIDNIELVKSAIKDKLNDYSSRHIRALEDIAEGRRGNKEKDGVLPLFLPYYLVNAFLEFEFDDVIKGVRREQIEIAIKEMHHRGADIRPSDISYLLHSFAELQSSKDIVPPIFDYDKTTKTMRVVDSTFYFFLRNVNKEEIKSGLISPI